MNPYQTPSIGRHDAGQHGDGRQIRGGFLFRVIEIERPVGFVLTYSGWWFVQRLYVDNRRVWWKVSWLRIERQISAVLPAGVDSKRRPLRVTLGFGTGLRLTAFEVVVGETTVYEE